MIIMDLEWNRSYDKKKLDEILQIGAVRVDQPGGPVRSHFSAFIRPCVHKNFDPGAKKLPDLQSSIASETTFPEAWAAFVDWCGGEREFAFWGPDDFQVIRQNCAYWGLACPEPGRVYDFQRAFAHAYGADGTMMSLWRVVDYLSIPEVFEFHNALYDALYTAMVGGWLRQEDLDHQPPSRRPKKRRRKRRRTAASGPQQAKGGKAGRPGRRRKRRKKAAAGPQTATTTE